MRIDYKILLLMFKCLLKEDPAYLSKNFEMLSSIPGKQKLRSANSLKVVPGESRLKNIGRRMFYVIGPTRWNNLHQKLRFSERNLKCYLFRDFMVHKCFFFFL